MIFVMAADASRCPGILNNQVSYENLCSLPRKPEIALRIATFNRRP